MKKLYIFTLVALISVSMSSLSTQIFKTNLKISVRNDLGNIESGVTVTLYKSKEDHEKNQNAHSSKTTNDKGNALFEDLQPTIYYVNAEKGDKNNYGAGEQTGTLIENKLNKVTIIISE